jgi:hypothetical protein
MAGSIKQSTEVMRSMQQLVKVPEIMSTMREMSKELTAAGIMEEMIEDTLEAIEPEELEEQAAVIFAFFTVIFFEFLGRSRQSFVGDYSRRIGQGSTCCK